MGVTRRTIDSRWCSEHWPHNEVKNCGRWLGATASDTKVKVILQWRHNGRDGISNHQSHDCLLDRLFRCRSKKTSKLQVTGLYAGNSPGTGEFPAQMASNAENVSIGWRHRELMHFIRNALKVTGRSRKPFNQWYRSFRLKINMTAIFKPVHIRECNVTTIW